MGSFDAALAALAWQLKLGADEAIGPAPLNRFELRRPAPAAAATPPAAAQAASPGAPRPAPDPGPADGGAAALAAAARDLAELRSALEGFEGCALKRGARRTVFADGNPAARVMVIGEAPGRDEDMAGLPFVGRSGQLLDRMFAAIGLSRAADDPAAGLYITNVLPWRPPQNRDPSSDEAAMLLPFLYRHIELADPEVVVVMGSPAARAVLGSIPGINRIRGQWHDWRGRPVLPMNHPAALLRDGTLKRAAWADLLSLQVRLDG